MAEVDDNYRLSLQVCRRSGPFICVEKRGDLFWWEDGREKEMKVERVVMKQMEREDKNRNKTKRLRNLCPCETSMLRSTRCVRRHEQCAQIHVRALCAFSRPAHLSVAPDC